jgi:hypothetical protein
VKVWRPRRDLNPLRYIQGKNLQLNIPSVKTYDELRPIAKERLASLYELTIHAAHVCMLFQPIFE